MNSETPHPDDQAWKNLLSLSAPTFMGESTPPFGFMTSTLARIRAERRETDLMEKIGWRALLTSLALLIITVGVSLDLPSSHPGDLEPGMRGIIQVESVPVS